MWQMTLRAYRFRLFFTELKQKQTHLWLGLKENFTWCLISSFLFPVKGESEVCYVDLRYIFWCLSRPLCVLSYQPLQNGKRMWVLWKDEDNEWQQAVEMAWLFPGSPCLRVEMVTEPREPWSRVQVNKQRTVGCIMISEHWGVCLLRWGFCRGDWTEEWLLLFKGDSGDVIACFPFFFFFWNVLWNAPKNESRTASLSWTRRERPTGFWGEPGIVLSKSVWILRKILLRNRLKFLLSFKGIQAMEEWKNGDK